MISRHGGTTFLVTLALGFFSLSAAMADPFAQYSNPTGFFRFVNAGANSTLFSTATQTGTSASAVAVKFKYNVANSSGFGTHLINAQLTFSATTNGAATSPITGFNDQLLKNVSLSITENGHNLLSITSNNTLPITSAGPATSAGDLFGQNKSTNPNIFGSIDPSNPTESNKFTFSSEFLKFDTSHLESYNMALSFLQGFTFTKAGNGYITSFTAKGGYASFSATTSVPEASTLFGFSSLLAGGGLVCFRRRTI